MRIAIIDDLEEERARLRKSLESQLMNRGMDILLEEFDSGEAFLEVFVPGEFVVVFLDIYMNGINGIDVAKQIYGEDTGCHIVFLTISKEHAIESYSVRAAYYLVKPVEEKLLEQALDFCFPAPIPGDILAIRTRDGCEIIQRRNILYIESIARHGCVYLAGQMIESMDSFSTLIAPLTTDPRFLICARGIMLQMEHVVAQKENYFMMEDGKELPISRRLKVGVLKEFHQYALKRMTEGS